MLGWSIVLGGRSGSLEKKPEHSTSSRQPAMETRRAWTTRVSSNDPLGPPSRVSAARSPAGGDADQPPPPRHLAPRRPAPTPPPPRPPPRPLPREPPQARE